MDGIFIVEISTPIKYQVWYGQFLIFYQILNALFQKKTQTGRRGGGKGGGGGGGGRKEFLGALKKEHVEVPRVN